MYKFRLHDLRRRARLKLNRRRRCRRHRTNVNAKRYRKITLDILYKIVLSIYKINFKNAVYRNQTTNPNGIITV